MDKISIQENFLEEKEFDALRGMVMGEYFPWFFNPIVTSNIDKNLIEEEKETSPGYLVHMIYSRNVPQSTFYESMFPILKHLNVSVLLRIKLNLHLRLPEPFYSGYHIDIVYSNKDIAVNFTTSILYINTNNGYTEFEDGTIVKSVANRLVSFPLTTRHRGVTQTDEQTRSLINFNYLKD